MKEVHILGGGIIGLCSAWYLTRAGVKVTVVDHGDFTSGTSFGNSGMIVPSHFVPMAAPGVITQGMKWMFDSKSPFYVRPRMNAELTDWLLKFRKSSTSAHMERSIPLLHTLNQTSKDLYRQIAQESEFEFGYEEKGLLMLYRTRKQADEEAHMAELAYTHGVAAEILEGQALSNLEPEMELDVLGGLYFPDDAHLHPNRLMEQLLPALKKSGVTFIPKQSIQSFESENGRVKAMINQQSEQIPVDQLLIAAGSWTGHLVKQLGISMPLQDGKGYSITISEPVTRPRIPTILTEAKVAITPMGRDLRVGGTLELSGLSDSINKKRVQGIVESVPRYYKNWSVPYSDQTKVWKGYRPCSPDGLPYIGRTSIPNLSVATGHGMMGLSMGAATGKLMSEILTGEKPFMPVQAFSPERF